MFKSLLLIAALFFCTQSLWAAAAPIVDIQTNMGTITVQLDSDKAPISTSNFLRYMNENFYSNTIFHRVIPGFVVQGGGFGSDLKLKATHPPIVLESNNGLFNSRGTIAMARTSDSNSATSQFYINTVDNIINTPNNLDYQSSASPGYAVFGKVIDNSMPVVDSISAVPTTNSVPQKIVLIEAIRPRYGQLQFASLNTNYTAGDNLKLVLQENQQVREQELDLWVAILMGNQLLFISPENSVLISASAKPFQRKVPVSQTMHEILNLTLPVGLTGSYQVFAIFNDPDKDVGDITHSMRSNLAQMQVQIH